MPHSSGGGSHGGGSHGGSHSSGSGSSSHPLEKISSKPFSGAYRYVYYRNGRPSYLYSNYDMGKKDTISDVIRILLYVPFVAIAAVIILTCFNFPVSPDCSDKNIIIDDKAQVITDEEALKDSLTEFSDKTGVTPAVMTVFNEDWQENYDSLENYAYDLYVNTFDDEDHWLIVYSEPEKSSGSFSDWYWEGMQGDNTDSVLNDSVLDVFNSSMQKYLTERSQYSPGSAISLSFRMTTPETMKLTVDKESLPFSLIFSGAIIYVFIQAIMTTVKGRKYSDAKACPVTVREEKCEYCGGIYVIGTCTSCPHCGAPVKPHEYTEEEKKEAEAYVNMLNNNK